MVFGTYRRGYPQGHDLRMWTEGVGEQVVIASGKNFDLDFPAISADGRTVVVLEVQPPNIEHPFFSQAILRWREGAGIEQLASFTGYAYVRDLAVSADGRRVAYSWQRPASDPTWGEVHLVDETGADRLLFHFPTFASWGRVGISADGLTVVAEMPGDPVEMGGPARNGPGAYLWREGRAPLRLDPPLTAYRQGPPVVSADGARVEWVRQAGPAFPPSLYEWVPTGGTDVVVGPPGVDMADATMTADGRHWTVWLEDHPGGRGLYRVDRVDLPTATATGPTPPDETPTEAHTPTPTRTPTSTITVPAAYLPIVDRWAPLPPPSPARDGERGPLSADPQATTAGWPAILRWDDDDLAAAAAVGPSGDVYLAVRTWSALPAGLSGYRTAKSGGFDGFVVRIGSDGEPTAATYLGGSGYDGALAVAVDAAGAVYVAGTTASVDFPVSGGAFQAVRQGATDGFVARLSADLSHLSYSSYLGGPGTGDPADTGFDAVLGLALTTNGDAIVAGTSWWSAFPTTAGAAHEQRFPASHDEDAFLARLDATNGRLVYSTYVEFADRFGTRPGAAYGVAADASGRAYVAGDAAGAPDAFLVRVAADGSATELSTRIGCCAETSPGIFADPGLEHASAVAVSENATAFVTGYATGAAVPPTTVDAFQARLGGLRDAFVARMSPDGELSYLTYLGGDADDAGTGMALDASGGAHVVGATYSPDFPSAPGGPPAPTGNCALCGDAFAASLDRFGAALRFGGRFGASLDDAAWGTTLSDAVWLVAGTTIPVGTSTASDARRASGQAPDRDACAERLEP